MTNVSSEKLSAELCSALGRDQTITVSPDNIRALLSHIAALSADLASAKEALGECQRVLVMLTEPREIRATNVSTAWATAVAAELRARTTLRSLNKEDGR